MQRLIEKWFYIEPEDDKQTVGDFIWLFGGAVYVVGLLVFVLSKVTWY